MPKKLASPPLSRKPCSGDLFAPYGEKLDRLGAQLIRLFPEHGLQAPSFASVRPEHVELVQWYVRELLVSHLPAAERPLLCALFAAAAERAVDEARVAWLKQEIATLQRRVAVLEGEATDEVPPDVYSGESLADVRAANRRQA